mmetsp:Transcript_56912/g.158463  ORF Transcript_56912/g.158463 Transcript_56912/m.158463 type:complete len:314 (+) Transcript_56912:1148-2089(+)
MVLHSSCMLRWAHGSCASKLSKKLHAFAGSAEVERTGVVMSTRSPRTILTFARDATGTRKLEGLTSVDDKARGASAARISKVGSFFHGVPAEVMSLQTQSLQKHTSSRWHSTSKGMRGAWPDAVATGLNVDMPDSHSCCKTGACFEALSGPLNQSVPVALITSTRSACGNPTKLRRTMMLPLGLSHSTFRRKHEQLRLKAASPPKPSPLSPLPLAERALSPPTRRALHQKSGHKLSCEIALPIPPWSHNVSTAEGNSKPLFRTAEILPNRSKTAALRCLACPSGNKLGEPMAVRTLPMTAIKAQSTAVQDAIT